ncbi:sensor histidine kinase [Delftia sp. SD018]|uniref:sensor histidine kinase n=1 Tax=unclassified Delftia TaxID=2613839 RepID=UPI001A966783|nr:MULTISPECIES: sensor histidine kinase [unclassified Delftia]MBO0990694.1 sensor histidine kinase [Delftia sp. SD083]MBO1037665.1 sensor histidine kinase [Delftia sp. SD018]
MQVLVQALAAAALLALLVRLLPNPQAAQGIAVFPGRSMAPAAMLLYAYTGSALAITLMSLILWCWLRERLYILCAALLAAGFAYAAFRYRPEGLWLPGADQPQHALSIAYCSFCVVATVFFSQLFEFRRHWIWAAHLFSVVAWLNAIALGMALLGGYPQISRAVVFTALVSTSFGAVFVLYLLVVRRQWQYLPGALAFAVPSALGILNLLRTQGLLPDVALPSAQMLWFAGRVSEAILLGMAVTNRTRVAERALRSERMQALSRAQAAERELESKVLQRTAQLQTAQQALQTALHSEREMRLEQRQFFNMINHEFRTPLTIVDGAATELQTFPTTDADSLIEQASQIRRASRRLMTLVDTCLINDRLDAGAFRLQLEQTPLDELLEESAELVGWSRRHRLKLDLEHGPQQWQCDPVLVRIAISNLVGNAIKYAKAGDITLAARCDASGDLLISVSDQGPGLAPEAAGQVFEPYERASATRHVNGHGLGLSVVRRIARLHAGDAFFQPAAGGGACFVIRLGRLLPGTADARQERPPAARPAAVPPGMPA